MTGAPPKTGFDNEILRSLRRITRAVDLYSRQLASKYKLTAPQLACLRAIALREELTAGRIAREVALSPATITGILDRLEAHGLIIRERRAMDKRQMMIRLTASGQAAVEQAPPPMHECLRRRLGKLSFAHQERIHHALAEIVEMIEAEHLDVAPLLASGAANAEHERVAAFLDASPDTQPDASPLRKRVRINYTAKGRPSKQQTEP
jgi:DNA-binding MarR family transcriptional regulator